MASKSRWFQPRHDVDFQTGIRVEYEQHLLIANQSHIAVIALVVGLFNGLLLIPDLILTRPGDGRLAILVVRLVYSILVLLLAYRCRNNRVRTFIGFSNLVSLYEFGAIAIYFQIMTMLL